MADFTLSAAAHHAALLVLLIGALLCVYFQENDTRFLFSFFFFFKFWHTTVVIRMKLLPLCGSYFMVIIFDQITVDQNSKPCLQTVLVISRVTEIGSV